MSGYFLFSLLTVVAALMSYINTKFLKLPKALGLTMLSMVFSLACVIFLNDTNPFVVALGSFDFKATVLEGMISFLLFANALHFNVVDLRKEIKAIFALASIGVILSTIITATFIYFIAMGVGLKANYGYCLVFGALISPTDPIAVISTLAGNKSVPNHVKTRVVGESLFNDATGIVLFVVLTNIVFFTPHHTGQDLATQGLAYIWIIVKQISIEAGGGVLLGYVFAKIAMIFLRTNDDAETSIFVTLAIVSMGYLIAHELHVSGPIAMVVAGLVIGHKLSKSKRVSPEQTERLDKFWLIVDNLLNSFLFVLIGLELTSIEFTHQTVIIGILATIVVTLARYVSVSIPITAINKRLTKCTVKENTIITWAGVKGGVSLALALSLPPEGDTIVSVTYVVVILSILIQGSTLNYAINRIFPKSDEICEGHKVANDSKQN